MEMDRPGAEFYNGQSCSNGVDQEDSVKSLPEQSNGKTSVPQISPSVADLTCLQVC
jgi:hypothetical protein